MKKLFLIAVCLFGLQNCYCLAQANVYGTKIERVKRAFIIQQLRLTPAESEAFFPLYNQYSADIMAAWQQSNGNRNWFIERSAEIQDNYRNSFVRVLHSHGRANSVYRVEPAFRSMLQNEMIQRQRRQYQQYRGGYGNEGERRR